jgi:hypothetical protein
MDCCTRRSFMKAGALALLAVARPGAGSNDATVDLDGFFGLHPGMAPLKPVWDDKRLAIVHACGSPDTTRSHFDAQDYMESGTPGVKSTQDGWLARGLQAVPAGPLHHSAPSRWVPDFRGRSWATWAPSPWTGSPTSTSSRTWGAWAAAP